MSKPKLSECIECEGALVSNRCINPDCTCYSISEYVEELQQINAELLNLLKDILEWDGILPHSKIRIINTIAKAGGK